MALLGASIYAELEARIRRLEKSASPGGSTITITREESETDAEMIDRMYALIDFDKVKPGARVEWGGRAFYFVIKGEDPIMHKKFISFVTIQPGTASDETEMSFTIAMSETGGSLIGSIFHRVNGEFKYENYAFNEPHNTMTFYY